MCMSRVSNLIYHKFSHGAAFYTLNGKNVNVMLECLVKSALTSGPRLHVFLFYRQLKEIRRYKCPVLYGCLFR